MPILVDGMENAASIAFAAWPERIYVVGRDGRIIYSGAPGPYGFDPSEAGAHLALMRRGATPGGSNGCQAPHEP